MWGKWGIVCRLKGGPHLPHLLSAASNPLPHPSTLPPHLQEGVNGRIVHLSNALCSYGNSFQYTEMFSTGRGWFGWAGAIATTASLALVGAVMLPPLSWVAQYVLPKPGQGPSEQVRGDGGERGGRQGMGKGRGCPLLPRSPLP